MEKKHPIKDYADGWIQEKEGTQVPPFLKGAFVVIGVFCVTYFVRFMNGEVAHEDRGALVQQMNSATVNNDGLMYIVTALAALYVGLMLFFALRDTKH